MFHPGKLPEGFVLPAVDYNVAPSTFQPVIRNDKETGSRELVLMRWGMIPFFAKSFKDFSFSTINGKAETVASSPVFRTPFQRRRCLIPASGFYEWKKVDAKTKQPYRFEMASGKMFAFAGLWDAWKDPVHNEWLQSFTIITTTPNELTAQVHNRMPVILAERHYDRWLARDDARLPLYLLRPYPTDEMEAHEADKDVGNVRNNSPELLNSK